MTNSFPELSISPCSLNENFVLDGQVVAFQEGQPMNFQYLQKRMTRKNIGKKLLQEIPVVFMAYDLLEHDGCDIREKTFAERRLLLNKLFKRINNERLILSPIVSFNDWASLRALFKEARSRKTKGLILKKLEAPYDDGRNKGACWQWNVEPYTIDAVLTYAQKGQGSKAGLFTDFTFGLWNNNGELVTIAKANSGLTDVECQEISVWIKGNTQERFGPVCSVHPKYVFKISFDEIQESKRHKSGVVLSAPRILLWSKDKEAKEANSLADLKVLLDK